MRNLRKIASDGTYEKRLSGLAVDEVSIFNSDDIDGSGQPTQDADSSNSDSRETHDVFMWMKKVKWSFFLQIKARKKYFVGLPKGGVWKRLCFFARG